MAAITADFRFSPALPSSPTTVSGANLTELKANLVAVLQQQLASQNTVVNTIQTALNNVNT